MIRFNSPLVSQPTFMIDENELDTSMNTKVPKIHLALKIKRTKHTKTQYPRSFYQNPFFNPVLGPVVLSKQLAWILKMAFEKSAEDVPGCTGA